MWDFFDLPMMTAEEYTRLPPLVSRGETREEVINRIVTAWCTSYDKKDLDEHIAAGGLVLERKAFVDGNTGDAIDFGDVLRALEKRLRAEGAPDTFEGRSDLHVLLRECRIDRCQASGCKIRPQFRTSRVRFGDGPSFDSATFGDGASFAAGTFGDGASFESATFGDGASFKSATFGRDAYFDRATFGDGASFKSATFGRNAYFDRATFGGAASFDSGTFGGSASFRSAKFGGWASFRSATFGDGARFKSATFGDWARFDPATFGDFARFDSATFGDVALFDSATFGRRAGFVSTTFGDWASFRSATFGDALQFLSARFGSGGGIDDASLGRAEDPGFLHCRRHLRAARREFSWTTVRALGRLQVLTRVSYLALVIVPILAGVWPAVRGGVNWINDDLRRAAEHLARAADRIENLRAYLPDDAPLRHAAQAGTELAMNIERNLSEHVLKEPELPPAWALAFLGALFVALGHLIYQLWAHEQVRGQSLETFRAGRNEEFRKCLPDQRRDLLTRAFPWLEQIAQRLPGVRHRNLVRRHEKTVWIPESLEMLLEVEETSEPAVNPTTKGEGTTDGGSVEAPTRDGVRSTAQESTMYASRPEPKGGRARLAYARPELELIVIDEGARAEYDVAARERLGWAYLSGAIYLAGVLCIAWLVVSQVEAVLREVGFKRVWHVTGVFPFLAWGVGALYVAAIVWQGVKRLPIAGIERIRTAIDVQPPR